MRSRYSAYVMRNGAYLHRSWHSSTRPNKKGLLQLPPMDWVGLEIVRTELGGEQDASGIVAFIARFRDGEQIGELHETSRFVKEGGKWFYVDGEH